MAFITFAALSRTIKWNSAGVGALLVRRSVADAIHMQIT